MKEKILILNLTAVFVVGFALTTFMHELAHAIMAKWVNAQPELFHTYVSYPDSDSLSPIHQLFIAAAGPLFSLFQGLLFLRLFQVRAKSDFVTFQYLWLGIMGMVVFLGYLMIGPFVPYGDTGKVYAILSMPGYLPIIISIIALLSIIFFFRKMTPLIGHLIYQIKTEVGYDNQKVILLFFIIPLIIGTVINVLISLPAPTPISLLFPFVISLTLLPSAIRLKEFILPSNTISAKNVFLKRYYGPVIFMLLMVLVSRILATGIHI